MSEENSIEQTDKPTLAVWSLVTSCYGLLYYRFTDFIRIMAVPVAVSTLLGWRDMGAHQALTDAAKAGNVESMQAIQTVQWSDPMTYVYAAVGWIALAAAIVTIHRLVLLNENPPRPLGISVGQRELRYIGYAVIVFLASSFPYMLIGAVIYALTMVAKGSAVAAGVMIGLTIVSIPVGLYATVAALRFSLALPAVAVDGQNGVEARLRASWKMAKGSTFKLFLAMLLGSLPFGMIAIIVGKIWMDGLLAGTMASTTAMVVIFVATVVSMAQYFIQTAVISRAYQTLSQETPLAQDG